MAAFCIPITFILVSHWQKKLIKRSTNLVGTVRKNRRGLPKSLTEIKLKRGEIIARQNQEGILVLKWKDKRDVLMLSTCHDNKTDDLGKPLVVKDYNIGKCFIDMSDQMAAYCPYIRKTTKWYIRVFFHVICQIAAVNAWHVYNAYFKTNISYIDFKKSIIRSWLSYQLSEVATTTTQKHQLIEVPGLKRTTRRRCSTCYKIMSRKYGPSIARSRSSTVNTRCSNCKVYFCLDCFQKEHKKCSA